MTPTNLRRLAALAFAACALVAAPVYATNVSFTGTVSYELASGTAILDADSITNSSGTTSGLLRLELWAFTAPHSGSTLDFSGYRLATYQFGPLAASSQTLGTHGVAPYFGPAAGTYYLSMILTEYTGDASNDGFVQRYYGNFPGTIALVPTKPLPPAAITPQVGLWWNPSESGSGYALDYKHGVLVVTVYSYKADGTPLWYIASGPVTANVFSGTLNRTIGGQCISCAYSVPTIAGSDGVMGIVFSSSTSATMSLPGGRLIPIVPQAF